MILFSHKKRRATLAVRGNGRVDSIWMARTQNGCPTSRVKTCKNTCSLNCLWRRLDMEDVKASWKAQPLARLCPTCQLRSPWIQGRHAQLSCGRRRACTTPSLAKVCLPFFPDLKCRVKRRLGKCSASPPFFTLWLSSLTSHLMLVGLVQLLWNLLRKMNKKMKMKSCHPEGKTTRNGWRLSSSGHLGIC